MSDLEAELRACVAQLRAHQADLGAQLRAVQDERDIYRSIAISAATEEVVSELVTEALGAQRRVLEFCCFVAKELSA